MAYSDKQVFSNFYESWSYIIRFLTGDNTVAGRDWTIEWYKTVDTTSGNLNNKLFLGQLTNCSNDVWYELPTIGVHDYSFGDYIEDEVCASGGSSSYTFTLTRFPIAPYGCKLTYFIDGVELSAYINASGNISGDAVVSGSLDLSNGSCSIEFIKALDTGTDLKATYVVKTLVEGSNYTLDYKLGKVKFSGLTAPANVGYVYRFKRSEIILKNTGYNNKEEVYIGLKLGIKVNEGMAHIGLNVYKDIPEQPEAVSWVGLLPLESSRIPAICMWSGNHAIWVFSNKNRVVLVALSNLKYSVGYAGQFVRSCFPHEYKFPLFVSADTYFTDNYSEYIDYSYSGDTRHTPAFGGWYRFIVLYDNSYNRNGFYLLPTTVYYYGGYRFDVNVIQQNNPLSYPLSVKKILFPIYVFFEKKQILGSLYDVCWLPADDLSSESIFIDKEGNSWQIFQDVFRTGWNYYFAIKID